MWKPGKGRGPRIRLLKMRGKQEKRKRRGRNELFIPPIWRNGRRSTGRRQLGPLCQGLASESKFLSWRRRWTALFIHICTEFVFIGLGFFIARRTDIGTFFCLTQVNVIAVWVPYSHTQWTEFVDWSTFLFKLFFEVFESNQVEVFDRRGYKLTNLIRSCTYIILATHTTAIVHRNQIDFIVVQLIDVVFSTVTWQVTYQALKLEINK
jgi:hypothetical protein